MRQLTKDEMMEIRELPEACDECLIKDTAKLLGWPCSECAGLVVHSSGQKWMYPWPSPDSSAWTAMSLANLNMPPWALLTA
jgi:hypothetical protein